MEQQVSLVSATQFVVLCYGNPSKLIEVSFLNEWICQKNLDFEFQWEKLAAPGWMSGHQLEVEGWALREEHRSMHEAGAPYHQLVVAAREYGPSTIRFSDFFREA